MSFTLLLPNVASPPTSAGQPIGEGSRRDGGYLRHEDNTMILWLKYFPNMSEKQWFFLSKGDRKGPDDWLQA